MKFFKFRLARIRAIFGHSVGRISLSFSGHSKCTTSKTRSPILLFVVHRPAYSPSPSTNINMNNPNQSVNEDNNNKSFICGVVEGFYGKPWTCDQRKDLFKKLRDMGLNSFMYAPKDDTKHRAKWRQPYSESEANQLKTLIDEAKANCIDFYYSLAPGLDMVYSSPEELELLVHKYDQLVGLGCEFFAILFDDIETCINEKDRDTFKSYAAAQVSVSNMIFEHLGKPRFLFCPTEYCESRAVPTVADSAYLSTLGTGLLEGIDIMWSGCRVISRLITEESIDSLTNVIRRPPVLWENLHANDYDKKRVFLGPYSGRSTKIIPKLRGVLTNPNCEYEANYIAIHTLAQWSKCTSDVNEHNESNAVSIAASQKLGQYLDSERIPNNLFETSANLSLDPVDPETYDPNRALAIAIRDWLPHTKSSKSLPMGVNLTTQIQRSDELASDQLAKQQHDSVEVEDPDGEVEERNVEMLARDVTQSSSTSNGTNRSDMDTSSSPHVACRLADTDSCDSCEMPDASEQLDNSTLPKPKPHQSQQEQPQSSHSFHPPTSLEFGDSMGGSHELNSFDIDFEGLSLVVDLFYLPFEHGMFGSVLLEKLRWLRDHNDVIAYQNLQHDAQQSQHTEEEETKMRIDQVDNEELEIGSISDIRYVSENTKKIELWMKRASEMNNLCSSIISVVDSLRFGCPNKLLALELYPYLTDMHETAAIITDYIKFSIYRDSTQHCFNYFLLGSKQRAEVDSSDEEPWVHRGGLIGDVHRILS